MYLRIALIALAAISISMPAMAEAPKPTVTTSCGPVYCCTTTETTYTTVIMCTPRPTKAASTSATRLSGRS